VHFIHLAANTESRDIRVAKLFAALELAQLECRVWVPSVTVMVLPARVTVILGGGGGLFRRDPLVLVIQYAHADGDVSVSSLGNERDVRRMVLEVGLPQNAVDEIGFAWAMETVADLDCVAHGGNLFVGHAGCAKLLHRPTRRRQ